MIPVLRLGHFSFLLQLWYVLALIAKGHKWKEKKIFEIKQQFNRSLSLKKSLVNRHTETKKKGLPTKVLQLIISAQKLTSTLIQEHFLSHTH